MSADNAESNVAFINSTYEEACRLTQDARDFFLVMENMARAADFSSRDVMLQSCEALRVTSRLTQVMAWLLIQKAIENGELSPEQARDPQHRFEHHEVCDEEHRLLEGKILPELENLLARSLQLYRRVRRLDQLYGVEDRGPG